jgi:hypothetical protein
LRIKTNQQKGLKTRHEEDPAHLRYICGSFHRYHSLFDRHSGRI